MVKNFKITHTDMKMNKTGASSFCTRQETYLLAVKLNTSLYFYPWMFKTSTKKTKSDSSISDTSLLRKLFTLMKAKLFFPTLQATTVYRF